MGSSIARFELALERLKSGDWQKFEQLCSAFVASDYPNLRTMASPSGDGGRDGILYTPKDEEDVVLQYSVQFDWKAKINSTKRRLSETSPHVKMLIFMSNQVIGAEGDYIKRKFAKEGIYLDIMDRSWFVERMSLDANRSQAAERLCSQIVDQYLSAKGVIKNISSQALDREESRIALTFLEMQQQDEVVGKNLTRSCFEALVKAALSDTNAENRIDRAEILKRVQNFLPMHSEKSIAPFVEGAMKRLAKNSLKLHPGDTFHLSFDEQSSVKEKSAQLILMREALEKDVLRAVGSAGALAVQDISLIIDSTYLIIETYFLQKGEIFASALANDRFLPVDEGDLRTIVAQKFPKSVIKGRDPISFGTYIVHEVLSSPSEMTMKYLKLMSDSYTLMSFLSETPDVHSVTKKMFSHGEVWMDTSVLLPVIAEQAVGMDERPFTDMFKQAKRSGMTFLVTPGIITEMVSHMNLCFSCLNNKNWKGSVPYVLAQYILSGRRKDKFTSWSENILGRVNPAEDIAEYLNVEFDISVESPELSDAVPEYVVSDIKSYWSALHYKRRGGAENVSVMLDQLAKHDAENCLSVVSKRQSELGKSPLGHSSWWLTLDRGATRMLASGELTKETKGYVKNSPVMSLDFLFKFLSFGPNRDQNYDATRRAGRIFSAEIIDGVPRELIQIAEAIRIENEGVDDRIIRRKIREAIEREKAKTGVLHDSNLEEVGTSLAQHYY